LEDEDMNERSSEIPPASRKSIRLKKYPYKKPGYYFVTFATKNLECLFGEVVEGEMRLNEFGSIAQEEWRKSGQMRPGIELDEFVIMPNHIHGVIRIKEWGGGSLGTIIGGFKAAVSSRIKAMQAARREDNIESGRKPPISPIWHRNYYERIVRGARDLDRIRKYIRDNPRKWGANKGRENSRKNAWKD
jgi:putative transposase